MPLICNHPDTPIPVACTTFEPERVYLNGEAVSLMTFLDAVADLLPKLRSDTVTVHLAGHELVVHDLFEVTWYVLTHTDLMASDDPRLAFLERASDLRIPRRAHDFAGELRRLTTVPGRLAIANRARVRTQRLGVRPARGGNPL